MTCERRRGAVAKRPHISELFKHEFVLKVPLVHFQTPQDVSPSAANSYFGFQIPRITRIQCSGINDNSDVAAVCGCSGLV